MKAYVFPGQGSQFIGMGKDLYESSSLAKSLFEQANDILGFSITDIMFDGSIDALKQTKVTQPAVFVHSVVLASLINQEPKPAMVAGHSLGEFSALVANGVLTFEAGLKLVSKRAQAMQQACEISNSTMAAILGLEDAVVEDICKEVGEEVSPANYNCPGQLVISGGVDAINAACEKAKEKGAKRALILPVSGGFHSKFMEPARAELEVAINNTVFKEPLCPIYQNVTASSVKSASEIKDNLIQQLTAPVKWTQSVQQMVNDGATTFVEVGPGKVLQGLVKKINRNATTLQAAI